MTCTITVTRAEGVKCPRCYRVTPEGTVNYDALCDRCCTVLLNDFPTHPVCAGILSAKAQQRARWTP